MTMSDLLTRGTEAVASHPLARGGNVDAVIRTGRRRRTRRRTVAGSTAALLVLAAGFAVLRPTEQSVVTRDGSVDAGGLLMANGAADFYDLNPSVVPSGWRRRVNTDLMETAVCTKVEAGVAEPVCTETEGPGLVGQVDHLAPGNPHSTPFDQSEDPSAKALSVITMRGSVDLDSYVQDNFWPLDGVPPPVPVSVRGHRAWSYTDNGVGTPAVTWRENERVIISVVGLHVDPSVVATAAESLRTVQVKRLPIALSAAKLDGVAWTASNNSHPYLLAEKEGDLECVGFSYFEGCNQAPEGRLWSIPTDTGYVVLGAALPGAGLIEAVAADGTVVASDTAYTLPGFASAFFRVSVGVEPPTALVVHHGPATSKLVFGPPYLGKSVIPESVDGVTTTFLNGADLSLSRSTWNHYRFLEIKPRTAHRADGTPVNIGTCYILETFESNSAWCGEVGDPVVLQSGTSTAIVAKPGWLLNQREGGQLGDNATDTVTGVYAIGNTSEPVMATPPGASSPVSLTPLPSITFAELTAKLTDG
jgi:hypothetical protein